MQLWGKFVHRAVGPRPNTHKTEVELKTVMVLGWDVRTNHVGDVFWPLIFILRICGHCPLIYEKPEVSLKNISPNFFPAYKFKWRSWWTTWSVICVILYIIMWTAFILETHTSFRIHLEGGVTQQVAILRSLAAPEAGVGQVSRQALVFALKWVFIGYASVHITDATCGVLESGRFAAFLNNWTAFQDDFRTVFSGKSFENTKTLSGFRNKIVLIYVVGPILALLPTLAFGFGKHDFSAATIPYLAHVMVILLEDVKMILSCRALAFGFEVMRRAMGESIEREPLTLSRTKKWTDVIRKLRAQVIAAGNYQKDHQLILLAWSLLVVTCLLFVILNAVFDSPHSLTMRIVTSSYAVVIVGRVYAKILAAGLITQQESLIANDLEVMNIAEMNLAVQMQIKFMYDMIKQEPSIITYGNYVTLDKKLLLGIVSQVVTYLIVLMQFSAPQKSD